MQDHNEKKRREKNPPLRKHNYFLQLLGLIFNNLIAMLRFLETAVELRLRRFLGLFWLIFDFKLQGPYTQVDITPAI